MDQPGSLSSSQDQAIHPYSEADKNSPSPILRYILRLTILRYILVLYVWSSRSSASLRFSPKSQ